MPPRWALILVVAAVLYSVGKLTASPASRNGGTPKAGVSQTDLPYVCSLRREIVHWCSGTILNPNWLLTSGHCVHDRPAIGAVAVVCGVRMYRTLAEVVLHPGFSSSPMRNDLALLMMQKPLTFTTHVQPIPLFDSLELPDASCGWPIIVGFERSVVGGARDWGNPSLQMARAAILAPSVCRQRLGPSLAAYLTESNICTDNVASGLATCVGDSGAPVMVATDRQPYNLLAIASWTVAPCGTGPSVHVRVASHLDWILGVIALN